MGARSLDLGSSKQGKRSLSPRGTLKDEEKEGTACWSVRLDRVFPLQGLSPCLNGREGRLSDVRVSLEAECLAHRAFPHRSSSIRP